MSKFTKRITAMLLSGMLAIGSATGSVYAAAYDADPSLTSEITEEVFAEEPVETAEAPTESAQTSEVAEEVFPEEGTAESTEAPVNQDQIPEATPLEEAVTSYTVTLDANGGYFANEWDDSISDYVEQTEVVVKQIPVGGTVTAVPVFAEQDGQSMVFTGWSLERDGELVSTGDEEYAPVESCVLYAAWKTTETAAEPDEVAWGEVEVNEGESTDSIETAQDTGIVEETAKLEETSEELFDGGLRKEEADSFLIESTDSEKEIVSEDASKGIVDSGTCGENLTWTLDEDGTLTISGVGEMEDFTSPWNKYIVQKVIINNGVTHIGRSAFDGCENINSIVIPDSVTSIGSAAFRYCSSLSSITIPEKVTRIGNGVFEECRNLNNIIIPDSVTSIGDTAFMNCISLSDIIIPSNVTKIGTSSFSGCRNLVNITIPRGVTNINDFAFSDCISLSSIVLPDTITSIRFATFSGCSSLASVMIPNSITSIESSAFEGCKSLTSITIPDSITGIDSYAFSECTHLSSAYIPATVERIDYANFLYYNDRTGEREAIPGLTISGYSGTEAQRYAEQYNIPFASLSIPISGADISILDQIFTGEVLRPEVSVVLNDTQLRQDIDYTVTYGNNYNAGTATVSITGKNKYEGTKEATFTIQKASQPLRADNIFLRYPYNAEMHVYGNEGALTYESSNSAVAIVDTSGIVTAKGAGTATITITAAETDNYKLTNTTITVTVPKWNQPFIATDLYLTYPNSGIITVFDNEGELTYKSSNKDVATVDSKGRVTAKGAGVAKITITAAATSNCNETTKQIIVTVAKASQSITAKAAASRIAVGKTTTVSITGNKGTKSFKSSNTGIATVDKTTGKVTAKKVGTVKITATSAATANYKAASKTVTIKVVPAATASLKADNQATGIKLTWKKVTGANGYKIYRGSTLIKTITSGSTVTYADTKANTNGTKYTYKVVAKATTGDSTLSKSVAVYRVARPAVSSVTNSAASKMTVKWGKNAKATGNQIQYSTDKTFKTGNKAVTVAGASSVSKVIGNLTKSKTYYVRIRTYKTVGSAKYWSVWSAAKSVKIAK